LHLIKLTRFLVKTKCLNSFYHKTVNLNHPRGLPNRFIKFDQKELSKLEDEEVSTEKTKQIALTVNENSVVSIPTDSQLHFEIDSVLKNRSLDHIESQKEISNLIKSFQNEFQFYYLVENYSNKFTIDHLILFVSRLTNLRRENPNEKFELIPKIQNKVDKLFFKHGPHLSAINCFYFLRDLNNLEQNLSNQSVQILLQLLKYHVNQIELDKLVGLKVILNEFKIRYNQSEKNKNEFIDYLVRNLELALKYSVQLKQSELGTLQKASSATDMLVHFTNDLSQFHYSQLINYLATKWKYLKPIDILNLLESLAQRDLKHIPKLNLICGYVQKNFKLFDSKDLINKDKFIDNIYSYRLLKALNKLNFYYNETVELLIENILEIINSKTYLDLKLDETSSHVKIINCLFDSCIKYYCHKNMNLMKYFMNKYVNVDLPLKIGYENENINYHNFLYYVALCKYDQ
jgi:hypothetical protein